MATKAVRNLTFLLFISIFLQITAAGSLAFLRALAEEEADEDQQLAFEDVENTNTIVDYEPKYTPTNKKSKEWVEVTISGSPRSHVLSKGQYYELTCLADGGPAPKIYWLRGGNIQRQLDELKKTSLAFDPSLLLETGAAKMESKYVIDCASKQDEGPIHCVAIAGEKVKWESTVIVVSDNANSTRNSGSCGSSRRPVITHHASTVLALQGTTVILPCVATGKPRPYITWQTSEGALITNHLSNPRYKVLATGDLLIDGLEWTDMNGYNCIARSNLGEDRVSTFIYPVKRDDRR